VAIGFTGAAGITQQIDNKAPLKILFLEEGLSAFGAMGNVTRTAKHPNAARVWINYVTSKYGSTLMSKTGSYGTHMDSPPPQAAGYTFPAQDKVFNVSIDQWEKIVENYPREWREVFEKKK
jgi:iron(III) transport system substrate-binding protein